MRKVSIALVLGLMISACGGEEAPPKTPTAPEPTPAPTATATETAKTEEPKVQASPADLQKKTMLGIADAMNGHDAKKIASFYTENAVMKMPGMPDLTGREAIQTHFQKMFDAFSNGKGGSSRVWMKGDVVIEEWAWSGVNTGEMHGMKATEKQVGAMGVSVTWFTPEGMIKEEHVYQDMGTLMSQMGISKQKARPVPAIPTGAPQVFTSTGSPEEAKNIEAAEKFMATFEKKNEAEFLGAMADNVEWDDMTSPDTMKGKDSGKKFFKMMTTAFPDAKSVHANTWAAGDYVIVEGSMTGTHKGPLMGIQPTKKQVNTHGVDIMQFKDGKVVKGWSYGNSAEMMTQLGLMPQPKDAKAAPAKTDAKPAPAKTDAKPAPAKTDAKPAPAKTDAKK